MSGVAIVSVATIDDQVKLGKLKVIPIKGVHIERTLWQLKSPGRLDVPAAVAFEGDHPGDKGREHGAADAGRQSAMRPE